MNYRNWDNWNRYFDDSNNPLRGCVEFYVADGDSRARIFDSDGTPMSNPVLTDVFGRTERQVFVDTDVVARFYKYIGTGSWSTQTDIDTSDVTKWSQQYSVDSKLDVTAELSTDYAIAVSTVEDLRAINPDDVPEIDGVKFVQLLGYFTSGDKSPVLYWYDESSTEADDAGSIIQGTELTGRWKLVSPEVHLDVRHFGVFPHESSNAIENQRVQIVRAVNYANRVGLSVWFPRYENSTPNLIEHKWYRYDNIDVTIINGLDVDNGVLFIDEGTASTIRTPVIHGDPYFESHNTTLYTQFAKSSWNIRGLNKYDSYESAKYIIDDNTKSTGVNSLSMFDVSVNRSIDGFTFYMCKISGFGMITGTRFTECTIDMVATIGEHNSFTSCELNERMFNGSLVQVDSVSNCTIDIDDFSHKIEMWTYLMWLNGDSTFDFKNHEIPEDLKIDYAALDKNYIISNFNGKGTNRLVEFGLAHSYTFNNCTGTFELDFNTTGNVYIFNDCTVTLKVNQNRSNANSFLINGSTVVFKDALPGSTITTRSSDVYLRDTYDTVSMRDSTLLEEVSSILYVNSFSSYNSVLNKPIQSKMSVVKDSQINAPYIQIDRQLESTLTVQSSWDPELYVATNYVIDGNFDNNIFNGQLTLQSAHPDTLVRGLILTNNQSFLQTPVSINRTNIRKEDDLHYYVYKNNSGTMEMVNHLTIVHIEELVGDPPYNSNVILANSGVPGYVFECRTASPTDPGSMFANSMARIRNGELVTDYSQYFAIVKLFSIGYQNVKFNVQVSIYNRASLLWENDFGTYYKYSTVSTGTEILKAPRSQGYQYPVNVNRHISYPYQVEWHPGLNNWTIKGLNIGIGYSVEAPTSENPLDLTIKQV